MTPARCPHELRPAMAEMLEELEYQRMHVGLIPAHEPRHTGHYVRCVFARNPAWYRDMCANYTRTRRTRKARYHDPLFKRADVARVLRLLLSGGSRSYLAVVLLGMAARTHAQTQEVAA